RAPHLRTHYRALGPIDAELVLGLAPDYVLGWTAGWDTGDAAFPASPRTTEPFTLGVLDGAACWRAGTAAGLRDGSGSRAARSESEPGAPRCPHPCASGGGSWSRRATRSSAAAGTGRCACRTGGLRRSPATRIRAPFAISWLIYAVSEPARPARPERRTSDDRARAALR